MHIAAEAAKTEVVEMLLKAGPDLTVKDRVRCICHINEIKLYTNAILKMIINVSLCRSMIH